MSGNHTFRAVIDEADVIGENDENNNEKSGTLSLGQDEDTIQETPAPGTEKAGPSTATDNTSDILREMLLEEASANESIAENLSDTSPAGEPWWRKILTNKILIIGVGAAGIAALAVLLIIRRKSGRK
ncbi:MAG: hypothetical protein A2Y92_05925 [Chloroflexi bacterium RBG_13_57_8]|nr:MAG: hypothetical protein A2Y92_05925 [Chloroflexi bacterium RBG_13_57_8]